MNMKKLFIILFLITLFGCTRKDLTHTSAGRELSIEQIDGYDYYITGYRMAPTPDTLRRTAQEAVVLMEMAKLQLDVERREAEREIEKRVREFDNLYENFKGKRGEVDLKLLARMTEGYNAEIIYLWLASKRPDWRSNEN